MTLGIDGSQQNGGNYDSIAARIKGTKSEESNIWFETGEEIPKQGIRLDNYDIEALDSQGNMYEITNTNESSADEKQSINIDRSRYYSFMNSGLYNCPQLDIENIDKILWLNQDEETFGYIVDYFNENKDASYEDMQDYLKQIGLQKLEELKEEERSHASINRDGAISPTKQSNLPGYGDCWFLSSVNALNSTQKGAEIIKDALEYHDGYTIVHLNGIGDYRVDDGEVEPDDTKFLSAAYNPSEVYIKYSLGDDDMRRIEVALSKAMQDIKDGNIAFDVSQSLNVVKDPYYLNITSNLGKDLISGGLGIEGLYFLTGKAGVYSEGDDNILKVLDELEADGNTNLCATLDFYFTKFSNTPQYNGGQPLIDDLEGNKMPLSQGAHAYAIKDVKDGIVTILEPSDSSVEYKFNKEDVAQLFQGVSLCDISDNNPTQNLISNTYLTNGKEKTFIFDDIDGLSKNITFDEDGRALCATYINKDGNEQKEYYKYESYAQRIIDDEPHEDNIDYNFKITTKNDGSINLSQFYKDNMLGSHSIELSKPQYEKLKSSALLQCTGVNLLSIQKILNSYDEQTLNYLPELIENNPNANFNEIREFLNSMKKELIAA